MEELKENEHQIVLMIWEDCRMLIAALKVQRWDVVKWNVAINVALAGGAAAVRSDVRPWLVFLAMLVSAIGCWLLFHYNARITRVRDRLNAVSRFSTERIFDHNGKIGLEIGHLKGREHDREELIGFYSAIMLSLLPSILAVFTISK